MVALRMRPEMICIYLLAGVVGTRQGPFENMKGLDVKCPVQGYTIWWLMKYFIIPATRHGVVIPGLDVARVNHGASQRDAMETSAALKLEELTGVLNLSNTPVPDLGSLFFQVSTRTLQGASHDTTAVSAATARDLENEIFG